MSQFVSAFIVTFLLYLRMLTLCVGGGGAIAAEDDDGTTLMVITCNGTQRSFQWSQC